MIVSGSKEKCTVLNSSDGEEGNAVDVVQGSDVSTFYCHQSGWGNGRYMWDKQYCVNVHSNKTQKPEKKSIYAHTHVILSAYKHCRERMILLLNHPYSVCGCVCVCIYVYTHTHTHIYIFFFSWVCALLDCSKTRFIVSPLLLYLVHGSFVNKVVEKKGSVN